MHSVRMSGTLGSTFKKKRKSKTSAGSYKVRVHVLLRVYLNSIIIPVRVCTSESLPSLSLAPDPLESGQLCLPTAAPSSRWPDPMLRWPTKWARPVSELLIMLLGTSTCFDYFWVVGAACRATRCPTDASPMNSSSSMCAISLPCPVPEVPHSGCTVLLEAALRSVPTLERLINRFSV